MGRNGSVPGKVKLEKKALPALTGWSDECFQDTLIHFTVSFFISIS
jgi:hypothetical protein